MKTFQLVVFVTTAVACGKTSQNNRTAHDSGVLKPPDFRNLATADKAANESDAPSAEDRTRVANVLSAIVRNSGASWTSPNPIDSLTAVSNAHSANPAEPNLQTVSATDPSRSADQSSATATTIGSAEGNTSYDLEIRTLFAACPNLERRIEETPIPITTAEEFRTVGHIGGKHYVLKNSIDLGGVPWNAEVVSDVVLDGAGYSVRGLFVDGVNQPSSGLHFFGLFGMLECGLVKNLTLERPSISFANDFVGFFAGYSVHSAFVNVVVHEGALTGSGAAGAGGIIGNVAPNGFWDMTVLRTTCRGLGQGPVKNQTLAFVRPKSQATFLLWGR